MKVTRWIILSCGLVGIAIVSYLAFPKIFRGDSSKKTTHAKYKLGSYYIPFEITEFNHQGVPCLPIVIENQTIPLALDLGSSGEICLHEEIINQLHQKTFLRMRK